MQESRWPLQQPLVKDSPLCLTAFERILGLLTATCGFSEKPGRYSPPGHFSEAAPRAKAGHRSQRGGIPFNRQPSKDGQHLTPTCVNCQLPTREGAAVGMPLLSWAFIAVVERSCSCGLRGTDFKGFFAFDVNPSLPQDKHVPAVVQQSVSQGSRTG